MKGVLCSPLCNTKVHLQPSQFTQAPLKSYLLNLPSCPLKSRGAGAGRSGGRWGCLMLGFGYW